MRYFAQMYLATSLNQRAVDLYVHSLTTAEEINGETAAIRARQLLADLDRAEEIATQVRAGVWIHRDLQLALILDLGLYDRAFAHAAKTIELDPSLPDGYDEMRLCHLMIGDHARSLEAANEALKRAWNDHWRYRAWASRAGVYRAMGDHASAERDMAEARRFEYP